MFVGSRSVLLGLWFGGLGFSVLLKGVAFVTTAGAGIRANAVALGLAGLCL